MAKDADDDVFVFEDTSHFTDSDWATVNRLQQVYARDGKDGLEEAMKRLATEDPVTFTSIGYATDPVYWRNAIQNSVAASGMDDDDLRELVRKLESSARLQ